jgi:secondary thiamine-phosphate synthase enzyme
VNWYQKEIVLPPHPRGFHLITHEIIAAVPEISQFTIGLAHIFICHTSAALAMNENADPTVRADMEAYFNRLAPENAPYYEHTVEGPDDMPAHLKAVMLGSSLTIPIRDGRLALGTWQGVYLCEHRNRGGRRRLIVTLSGQERE